MEHLNYSIRQGRRKSGSVIGLSFKRSDRSLIDPDRFTAFKKKLFFIIINNFVSYVVRNNLFYENRYRIGNLWSLHYLRS